MCVKCAQTQTPRHISTLTHSCLRNNGAAFFIYLCSSRRVSLSLLLLCMFQSRRTRVVTLIILALWKSLISCGLTVALAVPVGDVFQKGNVGSVCFSCCTQFCRSCCNTCLQSFCGSGEWGYKGGTVSVEMKVPYKEGLRRANNVVAAVLFYHPAKNSMFGKEWDPQVDYPDAHPRLLAVPATGDRNFNEWDSSRKVPIERLGSGDVGTWGIVVQEKILDGYAPVTKFCTGTVCFLSCVTLGIGYCWMRCQYDNCTPIVRNFYLLTDRRLIRYTLYTEGAKTVPKLEGDESGKSQFSTEVHSWIMSNITTFRYSEERSCLACCGECCCCAKRDYHVRIWTPFGIISLQDSGKDNLEAFLKSLMNQNFEHPLRGVTNVMPQLGRDRSALCPNEDQDVVFMPAPSGEPSTHAEQPLAKIHGETWGGLFWLLHLVLCRIATCCCFPRSRVADLYVTDTRVITSAVTSVPCLGKVMDTFTEYYALRQVKRIRAAQRYKCQCCGCMNCCSTHVFSLSTDGEFERSLEGEETYVIDKIDGVEGSDLNDQMQLLAATFALMNTTEGWLEKTVLEVGDWNRYIPEGFLLEEDEV